jgi:hypothetical protein
MPRIYTQPISDLENFEMSGDDLAVVTNCTNQIENDPAGTVAKQSTSRADTDTRTTN